MIIALGGCKKDEPKKETLTCNITSPQNGATISNAATVVVSVEVKSSNEAGVIVTLYVDDVACNAIAAAPYNFTVPSALLPIGSHTIKATAAVDENAVQATSSITITIYADENESPDFVTFSNGEIPAGWETNTWVVDNITGYDDHYSLKSSGNAAEVLTRKTYTSYGYIEFYTRGEDFTFYLNDETPEPFLSSPTGEWKKWIYDFPAGTYTFRWETIDAVTVHLDVITFSPSALPEVTTEPTITNIKSTSATSGGEVVNDGNGSITARGVCWSISDNPTINDPKTVDGSGKGSFTSEITGLERNTLYYVRAYATSGAGTTYGASVSFTTEKVTIGDTYLGGIVAYIDDTGEHGFIAHEETKSYYWTYTNENTGATEESVGSGKLNTDKIVNVHGDEHEGNYAAYYCKNLNTAGYADWFLPSLGELQILYQNKDLIGDFRNEMYWSSTEENYSEAFYLHFGTGNSDHGGGKQWGRLVRAIRYF